MIYIYIRKKWRNKRKAGRKMNESKQIVEKLQRHRCLRVFGWLTLRERVTNLDGLSHREKWEELVRVMWQTHIQGCKNHAIKIKIFCNPSPLECR
jgi:hypothetical protein